MSCRILIDTVAGAYEDGVRHYYYSEFCTYRNFLNLLFTLSGVESISLLLVALLQITPSIGCLNFLDRLLLQHLLDESGIFASGCFQRASFVRCCPALTGVVLLYGSSAYSAPKTSIVVNSCRVLQ